MDVDHLDEQTVEDVRGRVGSELRKLGDDDDGHSAVRSFLREVLYWPGGNTLTSILFGDVVWYG